MGVSIEMMKIWSKVGFGIWVVAVEDDKWGCQEQNVHSQSSGGWNEKLTNRDVKSRDKKSGAWYLALSRGVSNKGGGKEGGEKGDWNGGFQMQADVNKSTARETPEKHLGQ